MKLCLDVIKVEPKDVKLNWNVDLNEFCKSIKRKNIGIILNLIVNMVLSQLTKVKILELVA